MHSLQETPMGRTREKARLKLWRGRAYIFWTDYSCSPPKLRRTSCKSRGAQGRENLAKLVDEFTVREKLHEAEAIKLDAAFAYDYLFSKAVSEYMVHIAERRETKESNPDSLDGLSNASVASISYTMGQLVNWLKECDNEELTTGKLDGATLGKFFAWLATRMTRHGNRAVRRSAATLNKHKRNVKACLRYLNSRRPKLFPDFDIFQSALRSQPQDLGPPTSFSARELSTFLNEAIAYERGPRVFEVERQKPGTEIVEKFRQRRSSFSTTPVSRVFLLLALTGWRKEEVLNMRWEHVHLETGQIHLWDAKRRRRKHKLIPLKGALEGDVAPTLLKLLKVWRKEAGNDPWVLPHGGAPEPVFPDHAWNEINGKAGQRRIGPQTLRQNFCAYAAAFGVPPAVAALWQGHSTSVAESYYRSQVFGAKRGNSMEELMGLKPHLLRLVADRKRASTRNGKRVVGLPSPVKK